MSADPVPWSRVVTGPLPPLPRQLRRTHYRAVPPERLGLPAAESQIPAPREEAAS